MITADYNDLTRGHRNIDITNNELFRVSGINIAVTNAVGVDVFDNQFIEAQPFARTHGSNVGLDSSALVYLDNVSDVRIRRNVVTDLSAHNNHLILQSSSVSNVAVARTGLQTT